MKTPEAKNGTWATAAATVRQPFVRGRNARLVIAGVLVVALDVVAAVAALGVTGNLELAQLAGVSAGAVVFCAARRLFASAAPIDRDGVRLVGSFSLVFLFALLFRNGLLMPVVEQWRWPSFAALIVAALAGESVFASGCWLFVFNARERSAPTAADGLTTAFAIIAYTLLLKLIFLGSLNLIPEEAYYWNYATHLDIGYLDHPPMVAWLIWLSSSIFGKSEFSLRLPAYFCWIIAAIFMARMAFNLFGKSAAYRTVLLLAVLPIYFGLGFFMTPDAPLLAAWAGSLYFLERALVARESRAWSRLGLCLGLGMLSKYPTALLAAGIVVFLAVDRKSRTWLFRPEPYFGAFLALLLFSPVLLWNARHGWLSFSFQGSERWSGSHHFALHVLIGFVLLLLTPTGLLGILRALAPARDDRTILYSHDDSVKRPYLWAAVFTLVPFAVFVVYSCINTPKLNWTAPVWLAAVPLMARDMAAPSEETKSIWARLLQWLWTPTIVGLLFIQTGFFSYILSGLPGAGPMTPERLFGEWRQLANSVDRIRAGIASSSGPAPVLVGMDKNFISSELSFYGDRGAGVNPAGAHLFGRRALMWAVWFPRSDAVGKDLLLIDLERKRIASPSLSRYFQSLGDVKTETLKKNGRVVGYFYWRLGHNYRY